MRRFFLLVPALIFFGALSVEAVKAHPPQLVDHNASLETEDLTTRRPPVKAPVVPSGLNSDFETAALVEVNQYRRGHDLPLLAQNETLNQLAREHSRLMAIGRIGFGHDGFKDRFANAKREIPALNGLAENVAYCSNDVSGVDPVKMVFEGWTRSRVHNRNMLGNYTLTGMGVWVDRGGVVYFTQIFGRVAGEDEEE